jgi:hypothetical protein
MKRRNFIQKSVLATTAISAGISTTSQAKVQEQTKEFYEFRVYETKGNQANIHGYFTKALIPALNKYGVKNVGAFAEIGKSEPFKLYLLIAYPSFDAYQKINDQVKKDTAYQQASDEYSKLTLEQATYSRFESSFMIAFDGLPKLIVPQTTPRIFELRTYEGYSEDAVRRKIKMFNDEEFPIFYRTKLNPVFFGEVIAGKNLPCLTYMITFKNLEERDANWKAFGADPDWQRIFKAPEYANTVSKIYKTFLEPLPFSQI